MAAAKAAKLGPAVDTVPTGRVVNEEGTVRREMRRSSS